MTITPAQSNITRGLRVQHILTDEHWAGISASDMCWQSVNALPSRANTAYGQYAELGGDAHRHPLAKPAEVMTILFSAELIRSKAP
jgi:hypothetical protein